MSAKVLAIYIDVENLPAGVVFDKLMKGAAEQAKKHVFAVKAAYGSATSLPKQYRQQLLAHNFQIVDTPHVATKKNRADLIISIDAFERLHLGNPAIDRYVFVSSDSDFSVIMDRLRAHGKEVWVICKKADQSKKILRRCSDRMLAIESFITNAPPKPAPSVAEEKAQRAIQLFEHALRQAGVDNLPISLSTVGMHMRKIAPDFKFKGTGFKRLSDIAAHFASAGVIRLGANDKGVTQVVAVNWSKQR